MSILIIIVIIIITPVSPSAPPPALSSVPVEPAQIAVSMLTSAISIVDASIPCLGPGPAATDALASTATAPVSASIAVSVQSNPPYIFSTSLHVIIHGGDGEKKMRKGMKKDDGDGDHAVGAEVGLNHIAGVYPGPSHTVVVNPGPMCIFGVGLGLDHTLDVKLDLGQIVVAK
ncbi:unnamed protein product [Clonostachys rhizophaga]|uniref:Uncharacterized protein n=1 Tax=Clonostachys rhizophaga TaxID=160324 RepID=A0A9N9YI13_9HYPO|nr:unnamed protein product [Clonostachys rhizophaga]